MKPPLKPALNLTQIENQITPFKVSKIHDPNAN